MVVDEKSLIAANFQRKSQKVYVDLVNEIRFQNGIFLVKIYNLID